MVADHLCLFEKCGDGLNRPLGGSFCGQSTPENVRPILQLVHGSEKHDLLRSGKKARFAESRDLRFLRNGRFLSATEERPPRLDLRQIPLERVAEFNKLSVTHKPNFRFEVCLCQTPQGGKVARGRRGTLGDGAGCDHSWPQNVQNDLFLESFKPQSVGLFIVIV